MEINMLKNLLFVVVLAFVAKWIVAKLDAFGYYHRTYNHTPGPCRKLQITEFGSEDIQVMADGKAFITSGIRFSGATYDNRPGRIFEFDFNKPDKPPREITIKSDDKHFKLLSPHGINIWTDPKSGEVFMYVISHLPVEAIHKFRYDNGDLTLVRTFAGDANFRNLNDVLVVDEDKFFFTNYFIFDPFFELLLGLRLTNLGFFDGTTSRLVDTGLSVANGLGVSPDKRFLYLAEMGAGVLRVYNLNPDNSITYLRSIDVKTGLDNIHVDSSTGDVWLGAHPVVSKLFEYIKDPRLQSPSQVIRVKMSVDGKAESVEEILSSDGSLVSGSTVAVVHGKAMLVGTVAGPAHYCKLRKQ